jgi:hypothetical protein
MIDLLEELEAERDEHQRERQIDRGQQPAAGIEQTFDDAFEHAGTPKNTGIDETNVTEPTGTEPPTARAILE